MSVPDMSCLFEETQCVNVYQTSILPNLLMFVLIHLSESVLRTNIQGLHLDVTQILGGQILPRLHYPDEDVSHEIDISRES